MSSDYIGIRGSAKEKAEDKHNAKAAALRRHEDEISSFRGVALDTIQALVSLHSVSPISPRTIQEILDTVSRNIEKSQARYEERAAQIEEAYK